jgi:hypothetical protein
MPHVPVSIMQIKIKHKTYFYNTVDNQRRQHGAKVARFESFDLKPDQCVALQPNR